jgi:hypothetical protein
MRDCISSPAKMPPFLNRHGRWDTDDTGAKLPAVSVCRPAAIRQGMAHDAPAAVQPHDRRRRVGRRLAAIRQGMAHRRVPRTQRPGVATWGGGGVWPHACRGLVGDVLQPVPVTSTARRRSVPPIGQPRAVTRQFSPGSDFSAVRHSGLHDTAIRHRRSLLDKGNPRTEPTSSTLIPAGTVSVICTLGSLAIASPLLSASIVHRPVALAGVSRGDSTETQNSTSPSSFAS